MAEVIFAIMVLGIGLILLAAAFPVGIKQGEKTQDATNAALIAQHAYDQITRVVAAYTRPINTGAGPAAWQPVPALLSPVTNYTGKPLSMGLLDGAFVTKTPPTFPAPDLRAKLIYPNWPPDVRPNLMGFGPTLSDGRPQIPNLVVGGLPLLGRATEWDAAGAPSGPATYLNVWGYRLEYSGGSIVWQENVQWAYPADRRYYWYAFYRQMEEDPNGYPHPIAGPGNSALPPWSPVQLNAVRSDHISRRTYRVLVLPCRIAAGQAPLATPQETLQRGGTPTDYANQWFKDANAWLNLAPVRVPSQDDQLAAVNIDYNSGATGTWLIDTAATNGYLTTGIASSKIRRGDTMLDAWANVYQITDLTTNSVRLDRPIVIPGIPVSNGPINLGALPLWFNPNAIAVFPTIVTKQADLP